MEVSFHCPVASGRVISFSVFYRNLFLYYYYYYYYYHYHYFIIIIIIITILFIYLFIFTQLWPRGIVFCWIHVWINFM